MIILKQLTWSNCFSYGPNNTLNLQESTVTQIIGTNGMGKSSIPLIIEEVLYNKNSKNIKKADIPNRYINNGYNISLVFSKDDVEYIISVDRKSKVKVVLQCEGEDLSSHTATNTYKTLQNIIGIDFKTFSQLVYQNTNASLQFLSATDTNRKKFLIDLLHLEEYLDLLEVFKETHRAISQTTNAAKAQIATIDKWLLNNKLQSTLLLDMLKLDIDTEEDEKEFRYLLKEIDNISEKNKSIVKNNQYKSLLDQIDIHKVQSETQKKIESYDTLQTELGEHTATITAGQKLLDKLEKLGDICHVCEQTIDSDFNHTLIVKESEKLALARGEIHELNTRIASIKENNRQVTANSKAQSDWESLFRSIDSSLPTSIMDKGELDSRLLRVRDDLRRAKMQVGELAKENEERTKANTRIQVIQEQTETFLTELAEIQLTLDGQEDLLSNLEVLKKAFSTNGLLAYKIENLVKELEELTNTYLAELSDGRFTLEFVVSNDKLNVQITDNGNVVDITALSSGELARVNTSTLIAIRKLMSSISKSRINVLFLDEVIAVLDDAGREKLVEVLLGEENLNTYIVSHQWEHPLLAKINIVKQNDISIVEI